MSKIKQYASIIRNNPRISDEDKAIDPNTVKSEDVKKLKKYSS